MCRSHAACVQHLRVCLNLQEGSGAGQRDDNASKQAGADAAGGQTNTGGTCQCRSGTTAGLRWSPLRPHMLQRTPCMMVDTKCLSASAMSVSACCSTVVHLYHALAVCLTQHASRFNSFHTAAAHLCAGLVLVLAKLCVHMENTTVPHVVEVLAGAFQGKGLTGSDGPPRFVGGEVARRLGSTASKPHCHQHCRLAHVMQPRSRNHSKLCKHSTSLDSFAQWTYMLQC